MAIAVCASAQLNLGVKAGANFNFASGYDVHLDANYQSMPMTGGVNAGIFAEYDLSSAAQGLAVRAEILYSLESTNIKSKGSVLGMDVNARYYTRMPRINVPLLAEIKVLDGDLVLQAGPQFGIGLGASTKNVNKNDKKAKAEWDAMDPDEYKKWINGLALGLAFGAEYMILENVGVSVRYNLGLTNTYKRLDLGGGTSRDPYGKLSNLQVGAVLKF